MTILDEACLDAFRQAPHCEYCRTPSRGRLEPHHYHPRGREAATQLDIRENLIALCRLCHQKCEDVNIPRHVILALISVRLAKWPVEIEDLIFRLLRTPK